MNHLISPTFLMRLLRAQVCWRDIDYLIFYVTRHCNLRCKHCFNLEERQTHSAANELSLDEIERFARSLDPMLHLVLSGGEPFLRNDLAKLMELFIRLAKVQFIAVPTNGTLSDRICNVVSTLLEKYKHFHLSINLSLDGFEEEHDRVRGLPGTFASVIATAHQLGQLRQKYPNLAVNVLTVIDKQTPAELDSFIAFVKSTIKPDFHDIGFNRNYVWSKEETPYLLHCLDTIEHIYKVQPGFSSSMGRVQRCVTNMQFKLIREVLQQRRMMFPCLAGRKMAVVTAEGDAYPCETLWFYSDQFPMLRDYRIGSLRVANYDWRRIRRTDHYKRLMGLIKRKFCYCTWECALFNSLLYNPRFLLKQLMR